MEVDLPRAADLLPFRLRRSFPAAFLALPVLVAPPPLGRGATRLADWSFFLRPLASSPEAGATPLLLFERAGSDAAL